MTRIIREIISLIPSKGIRDRARLFFLKDKIKFDRVVIFISHPIKGEVTENMAKVMKIHRSLALKGFVVFSPYISDLMALKDDVKEERAIGMENTLYLLRFADFVYLYGNNISNGMTKEIELAKELHIPVIPMSPETKKLYNERFGG